MSGERERWRGWQPGDAHDDPDATFRATGAAVAISAVSIGMAVFCVLIIFAANSEKGTHHLGAADAVVPVLGAGCLVLLAFATWRSRVTISGDGVVVTNGLRTHRLRPDEVNRFQAAPVLHHPGCVLVRADGSELWCLGVSMADDHEDAVEAMNRELARRKALASVSDLRDHDGLVGVR